MTMLTADAGLTAQVLGRFSRRRRMALAVPLLILAYLAYVFVAFDIPGLVGRARMDNAAVLLSDFWSYKTHVTRDNRSGKLTVAIEGEAKGTYRAGHLPDWITETGATTHIDLGQGQSVTYDATGASFVMPGYGVIRTALVDGKVVLTAPEPRPGWINVSDTRVAVTTARARFAFTRAKIETFRYQPGWEMFFFTLDSPFSGLGAGRLLALATTGARIDPARSNLGYMAGEFWTNKVWHHGDVAWAMFETVLMAFLGTMSAAIIALPLAFAAARNFAPVAVARFAMRRLFDFMRGVDALIWTIILARAFGPGPMTGALAMMASDIGAFGKTFSEALENIDEKQREGIRSTGANAVQRARHGVLPQITPVLLSQVLYAMESNTRSATVIGAIVGGGIGLLLTQAIQTQKDWEDVCYYMILIVLMVMVMDSLSGWLRRKLIRGE